MQITFFLSADFNPIETYAIFCHSFQWGNYINQLPFILFILFQKKITIN